MILFSVILICIYVNFCPVLLSLTSISLLSRRSASRFARSINHSVPPLTQGQGGRGSPCLAGFLNSEPEDDDYEEVQEFKSIASKYLMARYRDCKEAGGTSECRFVCDEGQIAEIMISLLPPVTKEALDEEVSDVMSKFEGGNLVEGEVFVEAMLENKYWAEAGPLVVKELIFLDCLYHYYRDKQQLLDDADYNELKDQLMWEGSSVSTMSGNEALFVTAVANSRRGTPILSDEEYTSIKSVLQKEGSWVTARKEDALEKRGFRTFMSYLHGSM